MEEIKPHLNLSLESMKGEIWKPIIGYEGFFEVSNLGRVKSLKREITGKNNILYKCKERILKQRKSRKSDYRHISLTINCNILCRRIHRLVAHAFLDKIENKNVVNHINGIKHDNRVCNLEFCSDYENVHHAIRTGLTPCNKGESSLTSKLKNEDIFKIREMSKEGVKQRKIANSFNICQQLVSEIVRGKKWKHI